MNSESDKKYEDAIQMLVHSHKTFVDAAVDREKVVGGVEYMKGGESHDWREREVAVAEKEWRQKEREKVARFLKWLLVGHSTIILLLVIAQAFNWGGFELNYRIFYILVGGFFVETCVLFQIMCIYLFPKFGDKVIRVIE